MSAHRTRTRDPQPAGAPKWTYALGAIVAAVGLAWTIASHFIPKPQPLTPPAASARVAAQRGGAPAALPGGDEREAAERVPLQGSLGRAEALAIEETGSRGAAMVEVTNVPEAGLGSDSWGDIAGRVKGLAAPERYRLAIYAHTDQWYVQPFTDAPFTDIAADGQWSNWIHRGHRYAVLLVRPRFWPSAKTHTLPLVGGDVIARAEIMATDR